MYAKSRFFLFQCLKYLERTRVEQNSLPFPHKKTPQSTVISTHLTISLSSSAAQSPQQGYLKLHILKRTFIMFHLSGKAVLNACALNVIPG